MSRLLDRLDQAIAVVEHPFKAECLKAERAAALARHGLLAEARFTLKGLRVQSQRQRQPLLQAWGHFVTGMIDHFDSLAPSADAHFLAAQQAAARAGDRRLEALSAAWLANCHYNANRFEAMGDALIVALRLARPEDHDVHARAALVQADTARRAGRDEAAARHYLAVRRHAVADGDTAMISALMHNRASTQTARIDFDDAFGCHRPDEARQTLLEAASSGSLDQGIRNIALGSLIPMMSARLLGVLARWDEAEALYATHLEAARHDGLGIMMGLLQADRARGHWALGRQTEARAGAAQARQEADVQPDVDDRATTHARLAALLGAMGDADAAAWHGQRAAAEHQAFRALQEELARQLDRVADALVPS